MKNEQQHRGEGAINALPDYHDMFLTFVVVNSTGQDLMVWRIPGDMHGGDEGECLVLTRRNDDKVLSAKWDAGDYGHPSVGVAALDHLLELAHIEKLPPPQSQLDRIEAKLDRLLDSSRR